MKNFCNKGWGYFSMMEEIFPEGGSTGNVSWRGSNGTLGPPLYPPPPPPPLQPSASSGSTVPVSEAAVYAPTITTQHTDNAQADPTRINIPTPATSVSAISKSAGKKRVHTMVFLDESNASSLPSSPLFSAPHRPTESSPSVPPSMQGASKRSQKSALQTREDDQRAQMITISTMQNAISNLCDTLSATFRDELTVVHDATRALYLIPSFAADPEKIFTLAEFFGNKQNISFASIFLSLRDEGRPGYAERLYTQHCAPDSSPAGPSTL